MREVFPMPLVPRSGKCNCGGDYLRIVAPKPGVRWAILCGSCSKWLRWEMDDEPRELAA